ncbi:MAG: glycosyltransferase family 9 protein [Ignavibacteriaceae bacterium]|nr:glycosyltransferase family 9 protein [Ignavibacteriaceae bacterium]HRQ53394.1 glycosyltransferase family 9 protein [Ignavibacteriaceae bacterium]
MKQMRVLIARIDRIGDVVLSTPLPREIKKKYPNSFIAVLVKHYTKDIYINNPNVDEIICYDNSDKTEKSFWQIVREVRRYKFSHAFMLLPNEKLNYVFFAAGIKYRVGVGHKLYQFLTFTKFVDRKKYISLRHEADYCLDMVRKVGIEVTEIHPEIFLSESEKAEALELKNKFKSGGKILIGINATSGNSAPNLSIKTYLDLINRLSKNPIYKILITDYNPPSELRNLPGVEYIFEGEGLRKNILRFSVLDLLISSSTGPMHICAALKVPTLAFFCPLTACSPKLWGPLGNKSDIVLPEQKYCDTQCPIDPKKCDYSKEGGLTGAGIAERVDKFIAEII